MSTAIPAPNETSEELLDVARRLGQALAADAVERERNDQPPTAEIDLLRQAGLLRAAAPRSVGGAALPWPELLLIVREVASGDTSIGQLLAYHHINLWSAVLYASPDQADELVRRSAEQGWFWGDAVNPRDPPIALTPDGDGFRANGRKTFTTGSSSADHLFVAAELDGLGVALHVEQDREGIGFDRASWDFIGQRLTESGPTTFTDVRIERSDLLGGVPTENLALTPRETLLIPLIQSAFAAIYVGAARGALRDAAEYVRTTTRPWLHSGVDRAADDPSIVERFGRLDAHLRAAEALVTAASHEVQVALDRGDELTARERGEAATTVSAAKSVATETALEVTSGVFELQGARSASRAYGFDRRWRDIRTHTLHDPVFYKLREVGDLVLNDRVPEPDDNQYR